MSSSTIDIASVGNMCIDITLPVSKYPIQKSEHQRLTSPARLLLGGSLNALIAGSRLGAKSAPISYIPAEDSADGLLSKHMLQQVTDENMYQKGLMRHPLGVIPTCAALIDAQGVHTFLASNEDPLPESIDEELPESILRTLQTAGALIIDGFAFHSERALVKRCAQETEHIWLDPQAAGARLRRSDPLFWEIVTKAEGISLTLDEARDVTGLNGGVDDVVDALCAISDGIVLIKDGSNGCVAGYKGDVIKVEGFDIGSRYQDSIGAGDSFLGAFLAARRQGLDMRESCMVGNAMGAATCTKSGAGVEGIGTLEEVRRFLGGAVEI